MRSWEQDVETVRGGQLTDEQSRALDRLSGRLGQSMNVLAVVKDMSERFAGVSSKVAVIKDAYYPAEAEIARLDSEG